jgi:hypothetical protein
MDLQPLPSILAAIERGRHNRGLDRADRRSRVALIATANRWSYIRAVVLTLVGEGWSNRVIGEELGISSQRSSQLKSEACDAVLRSAASSAEAEAACAWLWRLWCDQRGDAVACPRVGLGVTRRETG